MKIVKYKKLNGNKYQVILEDNSKINLYEDVILEKELLLKKEVDDLESLLNANLKYGIYEEALHYISIKLRSKKEIYNYLIKKGYQEEDINKTIDKLIKNGYINDDYYSKCYINDRINLSLDGPVKIKKYLDSLDISNLVYDKYLDEFNKELVYSRINKYLEKQLKVNKKSIYIFKNKMLINLINLGYAASDINHCLMNINVSNQDELKEKEKEKLYKKLSRKYTGIELDRKVKEKLYQKGFFE